MSPGRGLPLATMVSALLLVGGCGVSLQDTAEPLPSEALRPASPAPSEAIATRETSMCFVSGSDLERVAGPISSQSPEAVIMALAAGPPPERQGDLRTLIRDPLTGAPVLTVVQVTAFGEVVVQYTEAFPELSAADQVLLVGQVTCSMEAVGIDRLLLVDPLGQSVRVPLPDGRVREGAATPEDYLSLLVNP